MIWITRILTFLLGFATVWGVVFLVVTTYGWEKVWNSIQGPADLGPVEFQNLSKVGTANQVLICPDAICNDDDLDRSSPIYDVDANTLRTAFLRMLEQEPGLQRVDDDSDPMQLRYVQRSRLFRLPDTIRIQFFTWGAGDQSTLALHGQSQIDIRALDGHPARIDRWLSRLKELEK